MSSHRAEVHFVSFLSGGFITAIVINPPEKKLAKRTSVHHPTTVRRCDGKKLDDLDFKWAGSR